jgi:hypothetical protein
MADWVKAQAVAELATSPPPPPPISKKKVAFWIVAAPLLGFAVLLIIFMLREALSSDEYYASSIGLSISECREVSMKFGMTYGAADEMCSKRIPKKRPPGSVVHFGK